MDLWQTSIELIGSKRLARKGFSRHQRAGQKTGYLAEFATQYEGSLSKEPCGNRSRNASSIRSTSSMRAVSSVNVLSSR